MEEENTVIGTCLVPFFTGKDGRIFVVLRKEKSGNGFLGGLMKKGEAAAEALAREITTAILIAPNFEEGTDFCKDPIMECGEIILELNSGDKEPRIDYALLSYLGSYWNTAKQVFNPEDKGIADWIIAYAFVAEIETELDKETVLNLIKQEEGGDDLAVLEIKNEKPELSDNYQVEIYNDALRYLKDCLNASYGIIS